MEAALVLSTYNNYKILRKVKKYKLSYDTINYPDIILNILIILYILSELFFTNSEIIFVAVQLANVCFMDTVVYNFGYRTFVVPTRISPLIVLIICSILSIYFQHGIATSIVLLFSIVSKISLCHLVMFHFKYYNLSFYKKCTNTLKVIILIAFFATTIFSILYEKDYDVYVRNILIFISVLNKAKNTSFERFYGFKENFIYGIPKY